MKELRKKLKGVSLVIALIGIALIIIFLSLAAYFAPTEYWLLTIIFVFIAVGIFAAIVKEARE